MDLNGNSSSRLLYGLLAALILAALATQASADPTKPGSFAYVSNIGPVNSISVIDTRTRKVVSTIDLGQSFSNVAVSPDGKRVYVWAGKLLVIDAATNKIIRRIPAEGGRVAIAPDGRHVYVITSKLEQKAGAVAIINTLFNKVVGNIPLKQCPDGQLAITPFGDRLYLPTTADCTLGSTSSVTVVSTLARKVIASIPLTFPNAKVSILPNGRRVYASGRGPIQVIDTATNKITSEVPNPFGDSSGVQQITPDGKHLYIANASSSFPGGPCSISDLDTRANKISSEVKIPNRFACAINQFAFTPDGTRGYVPSLVFLDQFSTRRREVTAFETASNKVIAQLIMELPPRIGPGGPASLAITADGKQVYATGPGPSSVQDSVFVIETATNKVFDTVPVAGIAADIVTTPPRPKRPFDAFLAKLGIHLGPGFGKDAFGLVSKFVSVKGVDPSADPVTVEFGKFQLTIPAGAFKKAGEGSYAYSGVVNGVNVKSVITHNGNGTYTSAVWASQADLTSLNNSVVPVTLSVGNAQGTAVVNSVASRSSTSRGP
jgi:YVTN family beta-propeller protein